MVNFNVMLHKLVPEHRLVPVEEEEEILKRYKISKEQLPKIKKSDPCVGVLEMIEGPVEEGRMIKVIRGSETAGISEVYRLVVG